MVNRYLYPNEHSSSMNWSSMRKYWKYHISGVFLFETLLPKQTNKSECTIVNLDLNVNFGIHWIAYVNYFHSFGNLTLELAEYFGSKTEMVYNNESYRKYNQFNCLRYWRWKVAVHHSQQLWLTFLKVPTKSGILKNILNTGYKKVLILYWSLITIR